MDTQLTTRWQLCYDGSATARAIAAALAAWREKVGWGVVSVGKPIETTTEEADGQD